MDCRNEHLCPKQYERQLFPSSRGFFPQAQLHFLCDCSDTQSFCLLQCWQGNYLISKPVIFCTWLLSTPFCSSDKSKPVCRLAPVVCLSSSLPFICHVWAPSASLIFRLSCVSSPAFFVCTRLAVVYWLTDPHSMASSRKHSTCSPYNYSSEVEDHVLLSLLQSFSVSRSSQRKTEPGRNYPHSHKNIYRGARETTPVGYLYKHVVVKTG